MADPQLLTALGAVLAVFLACVGAAQASAVAGQYVILHKGSGGTGTAASSSSWYTKLSFVPIMQAGVLGTYGIIMAAVLVNKMDNSDSEALTTTNGYRNFSAGLAVGLACLASGQGMATFLTTSLYNGAYQRQADKVDSSGDNDDLTKPLVSTENTARTTFVTWKFIMVLIFMEALGLYGLVAGLLLAGK